MVFIYVSVSMIYSKIKDLLAKNGSHEDTSQNRNYFEN